MSERPFERELARERVVVRLDSSESAVALVREFWRAMPHRDVLTLPDEDDANGWMSELTAGDRTRISRGVLPADKEKWIVSISGNHQPLTREADSWLRGRGL